VPYRGEALLVDLHGRGVQLRVPINVVVEMPYGRLAVVPRADWILFVLAFPEAIAIVPSFTFFRSAFESWAKYLPRPISLVLSQGLVSSFSLSRYAR
jgi:hypothetical protein